MWPKRIQNASCQHRNINYSARSDTNGAPAKSANSSVGELIKAKYEARLRAQARLDGVEESALNSPASAVVGEQGLMRRPRIADLLAAAGFKPEMISHDRAFLSMWARQEGDTTVATVRQHELEGRDSASRAIYGPIDSSLTGISLGKVVEHRQILADTLGRPIRVILQSKYQERDNPNAALAEFRSLDPTPWCCEGIGSDLSLTRALVQPGAVSVADTPWTDDELRDSIFAYLEMASKIASGAPVVKQGYYTALSDQHGRSPKAYEYRMQNISYVLSLLGRPWLAGLLPANNVEMKAASKIEGFIAEVEGCAYSPGR